MKRLLIGGIVVMYLLTSCSFSAKIEQNPLDTSMQIPTQEQNSQEVTLSSTQVEATVENTESSVETESIIQTESIVETDTQMQTESLTESTTESVSEEEGFKLPVSAKAYCVMDAQTGQVLLSYNGRIPYAPASITKVVTALAVVRHCGDLDATVTITEQMYEDIDLLSSTLTPALKMGEEITLRDLLYGMVLCSGNECASALAVATAGSVAAFSDWMNEIAMQVGAEGCHFVNAHGLDREGHQVTAEGMCKLWKAALEDETVRTLFSSVNWNIPANNLAAERAITTTNQFLNGGRSLSGVYAGKTGFTQNAGYTLVTAAEQNGRNLLVTVLGSENGKNYDDTAFLLGYLVNDASVGNVYGCQVDGMDANGFSVAAYTTNAIKKALVAYWTVENGQDDIVWIDASLSENVMRAYVPAQQGLYMVSMVGRNEADETISQEVFYVLMSGQKLEPGFQSWNDKLWMILPNGGCAYGWYEDNVNHCYVDENGLWQEGILHRGNTFYYIKDYQLQTGWQQIEGNQYYALPCGDLVTGKILLDQVWHEFDENGRLIQ